MTPSDRLKRARTLNKLTQKQLADKITGNGFYTTEARIGRIEAGAAPKPEEWPQLINALNTSYEWVLTGDTSSGSLIIQRIKELNPTARSTTLALLDVIRDAIDTIE